MGDEARCGVAGLGPAWNPSRSTKESTCRASRRVFFAVVVDGEEHYVTADALVADPELYRSATKVASEEFWEAREAVEELRELRKSQ